MHGPPLIVMLARLQARIEERHLELMAQQGFDDVRRAHNRVFANLPAEGARVTHLADVAGISKQAMAELVDHLVARGYLDKLADPTDGRAKLVVWASRGDRADEATREVFRRIEDELAEVVGARRIDDVRVTLAQLVGDEAPPV